MYRLPTLGGCSPVEVRSCLARWQQFRLLILEFHQLHEEVGLCQAEQRVDHGKVWLIKLVSHLHQVSQHAPSTPFSSLSFPFLYYFYHHIPKSSVSYTKLQQIIPSREAPGIWARQLAQSRVSCI